jgi:HD-GYP domain-containing protein (c-di-GMP phosphodiesterase class II)/GAF domain-containing protein
MTTALVQKLQETGVKDLKRILEATVKEISDSLQADCCQIMLSNPLDPNITSICEYRTNPEEVERLATITFPLVLHGSSFGSVSLTKREPVTETEKNAMRILLGELGTIIRQAQINDIVQRETFRDTFLVEIGNVMSYSLGIGDALFMVVNILGKVLQVSRCLFICTDDTQAGWKCYEFWQQDRVQSCQEFRWPTTDSPVVAQTLLSNVPLQIFEGQENSYVSPVQEEMQFIDTRSLLGVALRSSGGVHGCVILQQCDYRRAWTRGEIDMVQNVSDKVAEALIKLPAEKRAREPIMQLHQRIVNEVAIADDKDSIQTVRAALKGALGQQAIPSAAKTSAPKPPPAVTPPPPSPAASLPPAPPTRSKKGLGALASEIQHIKASTTGGHQAVGETPRISPVTRENPVAPAPAALDATTAADPYANLDFGISDPPGTGAGTSVDFTPSDKSLAELAKPSDASSTEASATLKSWGGDLDALPAAASDNAVAQPPAEPEVKSAWGDLDAIQAPKNVSFAPGLSKTIRHHKAKATHAGMQSALLASLHKDKTGFAPPKAEASKSVADAEPVQIDEAEAQAKINRLLSSSSPTSDYIFAIKDLDTRTLGRIDGWVSEIEQKDKYANGHARQIAEYSCAIAEQMGLSEENIRTIRLAALVHDLGKLGTASHILQKPDEQLSDPELITVMNHTVDGANLVESFPELANLAPIVLAHHEEFDGNGYPKGLKGEDIPQAARIIFVANAYHGMTSQMRYGPGMSADKAQEHLQQGKGKEFDPAIVDAFVECLAKNKVPAVF